MNFAGRRVLVTGASGFVGGQICTLLKRAGARVCGTGEEGQPVPPEIDDWHVMDVLNPAAVDRAVAPRPPDAVVHLAGQSSAAFSFERPVETYRVNVLGTWTILDSIRRHAPGARVLVVGSGEVYGPQSEGTRATEATPFRPVSPYALSKAAADALSDAFARRHGLEVIRTRSFGHTGAGQRPVFAVPSFARQIAEIEAGRLEPTLRVGNLEVTRDLTDVRDVVAAYLALIERGRAGAAYNVCRGEGVRLADVVRLMVARARAPIRVEVDPSLVRPADISYLVGDPSAIRRDTHWQAITPLEDTLEAVLQDWRGRLRAG